MFEASVNEFPFVAELPKREKSKLAQLWENFQEIKAIQERKGTIVPPLIAAELLGVCRQRVWQLMEDGRLERVTWRGQTFVTEADLLAFAESERKNGRPCGPSNMREVVKTAVKGALSVRKELVAVQKAARQAREKSSK